MMEPTTAGRIADAVPPDGAAAREINFKIPERYNASDVLFHNLADGQSDRLAVTGPAGQRTFAELCADAGRWGNAFLSLGLVRGDRVLLFLDDTPLYPAAFFAAVRAGTRTPFDQFADAARSATVLSRRTRARRSPSLKLLSVIDLTRRLAPTPCCRR